MYSLKIPEEEYLLANVEVMWLNCEDGSMISRIWERRGPSSASALEGRSCFLGGRCSLLFIIAQDMRFSPLYSNRKWLNKEKNPDKKFDIKPDKKRSLGYWQEATENSFWGLWSHSTEYMLVVRMAMQNQTFLLSTLCNQGLGGFICLPETIPRWPYRVYLFVYSFYKRGSEASWV